jgi:rod shape-determining protein MreD
MTEGTRWQFVGFVVVLVALHFLLRVGLGLGPLVPDLLTVAVLLGARRLRPGGAAGLGFLLGILDGAANPPVLGASALALAVVAFIGSRLREATAGDSPVLLALYLFAGKWVYDILLHLTVELVASAGPVTQLLIQSPLAALYAALAGLAAATVYRAVV